MLPVRAFVLFAAILHASWNALLRSGADRLWSMTIMNLTSVALCGVVALMVIPSDKASWPYILASGLLHVGYSLFLIRTYRTGDFGQTYPDRARIVSRARHPRGGGVCREMPGPLSILRMVLVSGGITSLAFERCRLSRAMPDALITGAFIGAFSVADGMGVRLSGSAVAHTVWMESSQSSKRGASNESA